MKPNEDIKDAFECLNDVNVIHSMYVLWGWIENFLKTVRKSGYPFFCWNGKIYQILPLAEGNYREICTLVEYLNKINRERRKIY